MAKETLDPRFVTGPEESRVREKFQRAEQGHQLRPGALCPNCGAHAFRRAELKSGAACPKCGKAPKLAA